MNIAVFISGNGTTLKRIIEAYNNGEIKSKVNLVVSSNETCNGVKIAKNSGINIVSTNDTRIIINELYKNNIDFIILAGYLKLLSKEIIDKYPKKIINIHPSLLPNFGGKEMYGINVHKAVILSKQKISGTTIHYVDYSFDTGEIIEQRTVEIDDLETPESLQIKIQQTEKELLIRFLKRKE